MGCPLPIPPISAQPSRNPGVESIETSGGTEVRAKLPFLTHLLKHTGF